MDLPLDVSTSIAMLPPGAPPPVTGGCSSRAMLSPLRASLYRAKWAVNKSTRHSQRATLHLPCHTQPCKGLVIKQRVSTPLCELAVH